MEAVSFEIGVAALQVLTSYDYAVKYDIDGKHDSITHHVYGFGGREVHLTIEGHVYSAEVAFFRNFEIKEYLATGVAMPLDEAITSMESLLSSLATS